MFPEERQNEIADIIKANGKITIAEIVEKYGISEESARRDLRLSEKRGICIRTHGGAILPRKVSERPPEKRDYENMTVYDNYREIARAAVAEIRKNDTVYLPGGSFGHIIISLLPPRIKLTAVVNSVDTANELRDFENVEVYLAGGKMRKSGSLVDSLANEFASRLHFDLCFLTGSGLTAEFGLSNGTDETATFQRTILKNSRRKILLMPSEKIGADGFIKVCDAAEFDTVITDWDCAEDKIAGLEDCGVTVKIAKNSNDT